MTTNLSTEKSPWGWGTLLTVSFFGGFAAGGIIAGINWRRMGKPGLMWPTIIMSVVAFILFVYFLPENISRNITNLISIAPAWGLWLWQKGCYRTWKESHPEEQRAGWQIPVVTVIIIFGLFMGLLFLGGPTTGTAEGHLEQGWKLALEGRYDEAIEEATKAVELDPNLADAYDMRAFAYSNKGQYDLAIADCTKAIDLDPYLAQYYEHRSGVYINNGQDNLAIADCTKAIELDPNLDGAYLNRGWAYTHKEQWDLAVTDFTKVIQLVPNDAIAYLNRGLAYKGLGKKAEAIADFEKSITLTDSPQLIEIARQQIEELSK